MNRRFDPRTLAFLGMMTALVFASNYARIIMPIAIGGRTSFTLANIVCVLSGLLLGPIGGLASGLGSALYDLTNPLYAAAVSYTHLDVYKRQLPGLPLRHPPAHRHDLRLPHRRGGGRGGLLPPSKRVPLHHPRLPHRKI